ncbi:hypothetical protein C1645_832938 [Glomus cerebriforme]|uniref:BTB/POZ domain-containing protein n=1 Tax=Glomus cerebriforme TaxID=658196 RepID=A0A397SCI5_9GLOM|nr:hypothetical protein C1645_832938 [Glomus cerebriforme]
MTLECPQEIINNLEQLLETNEGYDVIIYAGKNDDLKEIYAHSIILRTRSQYFRTAFTKEWWARIENGKFIFKLPSIHPKFLNIILRFIYCGKVDLTKLQEPDVLDLLIIVNELKIQTLIDFIQGYLIKYHCEFLKQNRVAILEYFYQNESVLDLWNYCLNDICEEPNIFFNSNKFFKLKAPLLEILLKRDDLASIEIIIWENLIKWCLAQNPNISEDYKQWTKEEISIMEETIHRFIPYLRFYEIASDDFLSKVYPYNELLPKDLINDILIFHMDSSTKSNGNLRPSRQSKSPICVYDSVLIKPRHFAIFASWIEEKSDFYNVRNLPYSFNLLYRASRDGNTTTTTFHEKCDNKGPTIVIVKILNSDQLVGGYNPLSWDSSGSWKSTNDSFIFSSTNKDNLQNTKVNFCNDSQYSIYCDSLYGPSFGSDLICLTDGAWGSKLRFYPKIDVPLKFYVEDYEVFQIIKRLN